MIPAVAAHELPMSRHGAASISRQVHSTVRVSALFSGFYPAHLAAPIACEVGNFGTAPSQRVKCCPPCPLTRKIKGAQQPVPLIHIVNHFDQTRLFSCLKILMVLKGRFAKIEC